MTFTATTNPKKPEETEAQITSEAVKWRTICNHMKKGFQKNNYGCTTLAKTSYMVEENR